MPSRPLATSPSRQPVQGRSKASLERMLNAAEKLLVKNGNDNFTLADVSKAGRVSVGSIYGRFNSKDELIQAVHSRALEKLTEEMEVAIRNAVANSSTLDARTAALVDALAEVLSNNSEVLRPFMLRASYDTVTASAGKASYAETEALILEALMDMQKTIGHADAERAILSSFRVMYASVARYLGFGTGSVGQNEGDWKMLKRDLSQMWAAFLRLKDSARK